MRPRSLRRGLTGAFAFLAGAIVLACGLGIAVLLEHAVWDPLDAGLREEAESLGMLRDGLSPDELAAAVRRTAAETDLGPRKFTRVTSADGRLLVQSGAEPSDLTALGIPAASETKSGTVRVGRRPHRVMRYGIPGGGWAEVGVVATHQVRLLGWARAALACGAAALFSVLVLLAWTTTARATAELDRLAEELETIEAGSLGRRLAPRRTSEVNRLAGVLDRLLARLDDAMGHLRRFTADASHELRTPLAALRAHLEVTLARGDAGDAYRNGLLDALEHTERLSRLAEALLTLSAVDAGGPVREECSVALDPLVREAAESLEPIAQEQGRRFVWRIDGASTVRGHPDLLKRVVLNLVDNAFRHTPPSAAVEVRLQRRNGVAELVVSDGGAGIPPDELPRVFSRFHRGHGAGTGSGLGLALCREIVTRHHGTIELRSTPASGTAVTVTLPVDTRPAG